MAYLALYRMFRPSNLNDVVRQEHIVTVLKNQIQTERVGHAYLFCGPRGTGKTSIAKIFAQAINCDEPVDGSPCGKCARCQALKDPSNLDITEIDAASNNGVDEMRDLREKVQYPPVAGKYKVFIIDEVHMLSPGAFNALLKTLEEPPAHAVFILATTESQKIPATILSRCMRFDFKLIPQADLEERLRYVFDTIGKKYEQEAVAAIARAGAGSVRDMLSVADTCVSYASGKLTYADVTAVLGQADFSAVAALTNAILEGNAGNAFEQAEKFFAAGKSVGMLLKDLMNFLNACAVAKTCRDGQTILAFPEDMYAKVLKIAKAADGHRLLRVTEIFADVESDLKYSTAPRILFETAVLKAAMPQEDYDIEGLIARISALEKKLAEGFIPKNEAGRCALSDNSGSYVAENGDGLFAPPMPPVPPVPPTPPIPSAPNAAKEFDETDYGEVPPDEVETGGSAYFGAFDPVPVKKQEPPNPAPAPSVSTAQVSAQKTVRGDGKLTFGTFLRTIRKVARNGVLLTMCMDLEGEYDGDLFVLYTTSDTIYRSLMKSEHYALIAQTFAAMQFAEGEFAIRLKGKKSDDFQAAVNQVKTTFEGVKIEVK